MTSSKVKLTTFWTKFLCNIDNTVFKGLCKSQVDIPTNVRVVAVQSLEISIHLYCGSHKGGPFSHVT